MVMSLEIPNVPIIFPCSSGSGNFVEDAHVTRPSGQISRSSMPTNDWPVAMMRRSSARTFCAYSH